MYKNGADKFTQIHIHIYQLKHNWECATRTVHEGQVKRAWESRR